MDSSNTVPGDAHVDAASAADSNPDRNSATEDVEESDEDSDGDSICSDCSSVSSVSSVSSACYSSCSDSDDSNTPMIQIVRAGTRKPLTQVPFRENMQMGTLKQYVCDKLQAEMTLEAKQRVAVELMRDGDMLGNGDVVGVDDTVTAIVHVFVVGILPQRFDQRVILQKRDSHSVAASNNHVIDICQGTLTPHPNSFRSCTRKIDSVETDAKGAKGAQHIYREWVVNRTPNGRTVVIANQQLTRFAVFSGVSGDDRLVMNSDTNCFIESQQPLAFWYVFGNGIALRFKYSSTVHVFFFDGISEVPWVRGGTEFEFDDLTTPAKTATKAATPAAKRTGIRVRKTMTDEDMPLVFAVSSDKRTLIATTDDLQLAMWQFAEKNSTPTCVFDEDAGMNLEAKNIEFVGTHACVVVSCDGHVSVIQLPECSQQIEKLRTQRYLKKAVGDYRYFRGELAKAREKLTQARKTIYEQKQNLKASKRDIAEYKKIIRTNRV
ncbi:hypothetical protein OAM67_01300 [bacterium]|nr:hypothetical protein [bacterium]